MRKLKLLIMACALLTLGGGNLLQAQTDVTSEYLTNADLSTVNSGWTYYSDAYKYTDWKTTEADIPVVEFYSQWNSGASVSITQKDFKFSQTITLPAGDYRIAVNALYRNGAGDGTNPDKAWIFAGDNKQNVYAVTSSDASDLGNASGPYSSSKLKTDLGRASYAFSLGKFSNAFDFSLTEETEIELGFQGYFNTSLSWCALGPVKLYKYSLDDYLNDYDAKYAEAQALDGKPMNADVKTALTAAMVDRSTFSLSSQVTAAIATLTAAINNAQASVAVYETINTAITTYAAAATALDAAGAAVYDASAIQTKYNNSTYKTLAEAETELKAALAAAIKAQTTADSDWTGLIANPGFEENSGAYQAPIGWTLEGTASGIQTQSNTGFDGYRVGTMFGERWSNATIGDFDAYQTITGMPAGVYELKAVATFDGTGGYLYANDNKVNVTDAKYYSLQIALDVNSELRIGVKNETSGNGSWFKCDDFTLTLVSAGLPDVTAVEGTMNATVAATQTSAVSAYNESKTAANYNAAVAAIAAAQASVDAYTAAAAALTLANTNLNSTNVYTAEARTAFSNAITTAQSAYDDNSMTTETAAALNATLNRANWGTSPAPLASDYMGSAWTSTVGFDKNFWSWEGDADGTSGMTVPFIQAYVGDANKLADNTITGAMTGLDNGLYSVSVFMRAFNNKTAEGDTGYEGISLQVNDGTAVDFADATEYTDGFAKTITAEGLVKDGNLNIKVNISNTKASWLAFKNVTYTKVRDLTAEEQAIAPTAIALYNGEEEVTENIILNGSKTTVTLTTSLTPNEATPGFIEWESADESVASVSNGVIKANGTGTTTITAKSTIDPTITATATVVTYAFMNQSFEADGNKAASHETNPKIITITGWTQEQNTPGSYQNNQLRDATTANASQYGTTVNPSDGDYYFFYRHGWNGSNYAKLTSVAQNLPIGKYTLTVDYKMVSGSDNTSNNDNTTITLSAISGDNTLATTTKNDATKANNNSSTAYLVNEDWKTVSTTFTIEETTSVQAVINLLASGPKRSDFVVDNVTLTWSSFKDALKDAIEVAEAVDVTTNVGDAAFQIPTSAANTFTGAISDAQGVYDDAESTETDYLNAIKALDNATTAYAEPELNAPDADKLYNIVNITSGFTHAGKALTFTSASDADLTKNTTSMGWLEEPGSVYPQGVKFTAVDGQKNGYKLSYTRADGNEVYISTGSTSGLGTNTQQIRPTTDASKALLITVISAGDNKWNLYNTENGHSIGSSGDTGFYTSGGSNKDVQIQEAVNNEYSLNIAAANQYGTLIVPFDVDIPTGVTAYSVSEAEGNTLTLVEKDAIKANTPYIVYAESGSSTTLAGSGAAYTDATYSAGALTGVYAATAAPVGSYVLQKNNNKFGFYLVAENKQPTVGANRCYLTWPEESVKSESRAFFFPENHATGIAALKALTSGDAEIYNTAGARIPKLQKGMNIIRTKDGHSQKVMVK